MRCLTPMMSLSRSLSLSLILVLTGSAALATTAAAQEEAAPEQGALSVNRALIAHGVEDRTPIESDAPFLADGGRAYVYLEVANPDGPEQEITLRWQRQEGGEFTQTLSVGRSRSWRTWGYHRMTRAGLWHVDVVAPDGTVLTSLDFQVLPEPAEAVGQL